MLEHLDVPFRDASSSQLVWALDAEPQPWLAQRHVVLDGLRLELRLLGASHQVLVTDRDGVVRSELVACRPGVPGALPPQATAAWPGLTYRFSSRIERAGADRLAEQATVLRAAGADDPRSGMLVGAFPGSPHAVTAIELTARGWRTWHLYPQSGEIVTTETVLGEVGSAGVRAEAAVTAGAGAGSPAR